MNIIAFDFETYWADDYTLSKMTTEAYVRDPRFHAHMVGIMEYDQNFNLLHKRLIGDDELEQDAVLLGLGWENKAALVHHAHFDGLILSHHFGIKPARWYDTLSMARALHGSSVGNSLAKLAEHYGIGRKGLDLPISKGYPRLPPHIFKQIAPYCMNDVELSVKLFQKMLPRFCRSEMQLIDRTVRMFTEPVFELDKAELSSYIIEVEAKKNDLLLASDVSKATLMSNDQFAIALDKLGVTPPTKISPATGKATYAFAKTDEEFLDLLEHDDERVQVLVAARLGNKSTIAETRAKALLVMADRGPATVYLNYCGAEQTHRHSGGDKMNWQNLPSGSRIRKAVKAPKGYKLVVGDSANIEARVLPALAGQHDIVEKYRRGEDLYCYMATKIFHHEVRKDDPNNPRWKSERFVGKTAVLGLGYGMGAVKFLSTIKMKEKTADLKFCQAVVETFRNEYDMVTTLWRECNEFLPFIRDGLRYQIGKANVPLYTTKEGIVLPNGLMIRYPNLRQEIGKKGKEWVFDKRKRKVHIYGGKVVENIVQALARIIVMEQAIEISKKWKVMPLLVHDEIVLVVPEEQAEEAAQDLRRVMKTPPKWWPDLPVSCDVHYGDNYLEAKPA